MTVYRRNLLRIVSMIALLFVVISLAIFAVALYDLFFTKRGYPIWATPVLAAFVLLGVGARRLARHALENS
jgi:hypothetical protein